MNKSSYASPKHKRIISLSNRQHQNIFKLCLNDKRRIPLQNEPPQVSERLSRRLQQYFSNTITSTSCHCDHCGRGSKFSQKMFQLYTFETKYNKRKRIIRRFRRFVHCIQFIIRYRIVQKIRERQRNKMKKAINSTTIHKPSAIQNLISEGIKLMKHHQDQDSDEEFYHFKPKQSRTRKSLAPLLTSPKAQTNMQRVYYIHKANRPISQYIAKRAKPQTAHCSPKSSLPQLSPLYDFKISFSVRHSLKKY